jgi:release factor glutamine methyltransferase
MSIRELIAQTCLDKLDTKVLLKFVLKFTDAALIAYQDYCLTCEEYRLFYTLCKRRQNGEPISYLINEREFFSYRFIVNPDTLIPRPETELVVDTVLKLAPTGASVLELGTGSGCIAVSCKLERPDLKITAVDKFDKTLATAKLNSERLNAEINFCLSDWYSNIGGKFNLIVSNPPYIAAVDEHLLNLKYEPQYALTDYADGLTCLQHIVANARMFLHTQGYIVLEHGYNQGDAVREMLYLAGFTAIKTINDYGGNPRVSVAQYLA